MKLRLFAILLTMFSSSISFAFSHSSINIKLPNTITTSGFVPIYIDLNRNIKDGDKLELYINNSMAMTIEPYDDVSLSRISTRIRATENPTVAEVRILHADGSKDAASESTSVMSPYSIPLNGESSRWRRFKSEDGILKMRYRNNIGKNSKPTYLHFKTNKGSISIEFTSLMSGEDGTVYDSSFPESLEGRLMLGYFELKGNFNSAKTNGFNTMFKW